MILVETHRTGPGAARINLNGRSLDVCAPHQIDGDHEGFCPVELLMAALSSCMHLTMMAAAEAKGIALSSLGVEIRLEDEDAIEEGREAVIKVAVVFEPNLTDRECKILFRSGKLCPVWKLISRAVEFTDGYRVLQA